MLQQMLKEHGFPKAVLSPPETLELPQELALHQKREAPLEILTLSLARTWPLASPLLASLGVKVFAFSDYPFAIYLELPSKPLYRAFKNEDFKSAYLGPTSLIASMWEDMIVVIFPLGTGFSLQSLTRTSYEIRVTI
ncbi:MAG: hypothetical protein WC291_02605 [Thermodesulfovibrionales bacterium]|jgi:hypothetical protein